MSKLIRLPDGSWCDPNYILYVEAADRDDEYPSIQERIIIHLGDRTGQADIKVFDCDSFKDAQRKRDEIAEAVNSTRD